MSMKNYVVELGFFFYIELIPFTKIPFSHTLVLPFFAYEKRRASFNIYAICITLLLYLNATLLLPAPLY